MAMCKAIESVVVFSNKTELTRFVTHAQFCYAYLEFRPHPPLLQILEPVHHQAYKQYNK